LSRTPGFTIAVVLTFALGIGANSAVFSALDTVLLQPLPFPDADRLVELRQAQRNSPETNIAPIRLEDWHRLNTTFEAITAYYTEDVSDTSGEFPVMVRRAFVAPRFHEVWQVGPALGRGLTSSDHLSSSAPVALVSARYWHDQLGADPNAIGRTVRLGTASVTIIGVMPASFRFPDRGVDVWLPVRLSAQLDRIRTATWYIGVGRLKRDVTLDQARANLAAVQRQLADEFPETDRAIDVAMAPLKDVTIAGIRESLWLLFGAVSVLLLITCTNVTALLLTRALERRHETSVRLSLGATRGALVAQMLTEAGILALTGGALGVALATTASSALRLVAADVPRVDEIQLDWRILTYTGIVTMAVALACGCLPAFRAARHGWSGISKSGERAEVSSRSRLQWPLVGAQVALSVTLLASAGLFIRSFQELSRVEPGFDPTHVLTFRISASWAETADDPRLRCRSTDTASTVSAFRGTPPPRDPTHQAAERSCPHRSPAALCPNRSADRSMGARRIPSGAGDEWHR
jgi:predicted permease